ncbi:MAG: hypothetical protein CM15mP40_12780 [Alphaproteobacteria bacterium]|nr:MAG: hypothetical protein CM15mP40_12780 [Alphaproteobacteria bacterium]
MIADGFYIVKMENLLIPIKTEDGKVFNKKHNKGIILV